ncbi:MAG TPA: hypothetical protein DEW46_16695 [Verrucomicrobia bacterium]|nr:hypothetical protein [Verrucomicrobiota bacterium]
MDIRLGRAPRLLGLRHRCLHARRWLAAWVVCALVTIGIGRVDGADDVEESAPELVRTDIEIGWEPGVARARVPGWIPFHVRLQNDQEVVVRGRLIVEGLMVPEHERGALALEYPVELAPGSIKLFRDAVFVPKNVQHIRIQLLWNEGITGEYATTLPLVRSHPDAKLVLHSAPESVPGQWMRTVEKGLPLLERIVVPRALTDRDRIPKRWQEYGGVDVIFLEGESWAGWTQEQIKALRDWVLQGGHLMVAPGSTWPGENDKILKGLLPAQYTASSTLRPGIAMAWLPRDAVAPWVAGPGIGAYRMVPDPAFEGEALRSWLFPDRSAGLVVARLGLGRVTQWAFSPSLGGMSQWVGSRLLLLVLMSEADRFEINPLQVGQAGSFLMWAKGNALALLPTRERVGLLLVGYLGVVLPGLYFICRLIRRRIWFWAVLPVLSIALGLVFLRRGPPADLAVRELSLLQGAAGGTAVWERTMVHVQSPVPDRYYVEAEEGVAVPVRVWSMWNEDEQDKLPPLPELRWSTRTEGGAGRTDGLVVGANDSVTFALPGRGGAEARVGCGLRWEAGMGWVLDLGAEEGDWVLLGYHNQVWPARSGPLGGGWSLDVGGVPESWPGPVRELAELIRGAIPFSRPVLIRWKRSGPIEGETGSWRVGRVSGGGELPVRVERRVLEGRNLHPRGIIGQAVVRDAWEVELYPQRGREGEGPISPYATGALGLWDGILQVTPKDLPPGMLHFLSLKLKVRLGDSGLQAGMPEVEIYDLANDRWVVLTDRVLRQLEADPTAALHPLRGIFWLRIPGRGFLLELDLLSAHLEARVWAE